MYKLRVPPIRPARTTKFVIHLLFSFPPLPSHSLPSRFPLTHSLLTPDVGSGERCKLPQRVRGSGRSPSAKCVLVHF